jgi:hypothetical protein
MSSKHRGHTKPKVWSIEPKAPSLVSLSVRDQSIPRPPKRSSSLRAAATGLKKGFSSHTLLNASVQDSLQTLRKGKHHSCSSLRIKKTRTKAAPRNLPSIEDEGEEEDPGRLRYSFDSFENTQSEFLEPYGGPSSQKHALQAVTQQSIAPTGHQDSKFTGVSCSPRLWAPCISRSQPQNRKMSPAMIVLKLGWNYLHPED